MTDAAPTTAPQGRTGLLISLEGLDGVGKTTQLSMLVRALEQTGREVVRLREPGTTALGEAVRQILLDKSALDISPMAELLLFEAARAQLVEQVVVPALGRGAVVVCDRFCDSTVAYQGFGRQLGQQAAHDANRLSCGDVMPDRTLLLDLDESVAHARACAQGADRMEGQGDAFQARVRQGFLWLAKHDPQRVRLIDAGGTPEQVWQRICAQLADLVDLGNADPAHTNPAGGAQ